jgi:predicted outer membrane repeat protein
MPATPRAGRLAALHMRPLAACLAAAIAAASSSDGAAHPVGIEQAATTVVVQNCSDSGAGSLRAAYANAVDNETIDLTQLVCSRITLGSALVDPIAAANVTLKGPGRDMLTLDGAGLYRVLVHRGTGALHVDYMTIANGHYRGARGGCIYSAGGVEATATTVSACVLDSTAEDAIGGAIYAKAVVSLYDSTISGSSATGSTPLGSRGGGVYSSGLVMSRSTVSGNTAAKGGGAHLTGLVDIQYSTFSGNHATYYGGALIVPGSNDRHMFRNSTISGNQADAIGGAIYADSVAIYNSTITKNVTLSRIAQGAGLFVGTSILQSSIVANNTSGNGLFEDDVVASEPVSGSNNLIMAAQASVPPGTITIDPKLGPLQDNGGATRTHALLPGSPAVNNGNNFAALARDQRGAPFSRIDGASADIGAFESGDTILRANFEPVEVQRFGAAGDGALSMQGSPLQCTAVLAALQKPKSLSDG